MVIRSEGYWCMMTIWYIPQIKTFESKVRDIISSSRTANKNWGVFGVLAYKSRMSVQKSEFAPSLSLFLPKNSLSSGKISWSPVLSWAYQICKQILDYILFYYNWIIQNLDTFVQPPDFLTQIILFIYPESVSRG